jgi:hypothetical protein
MTEAKARNTTGGTAQAVLPLPASTDDDTRTFCWRWPLGWDDWEVRLEAHKSEKRGEFGRVFISDNEGNRVELSYGVIWDLRNTCLDDLISAMCDDQRDAPKAVSGGADGKAR